MYLVQGSYNKFVTATSWCVFWPPPPPPPLPQEMKLDLNDRGPVSGAARAGEAVCVRAGRDGTAASILCMPVFGADGEVAGVVQVVGKKDDNDTTTGRWVSCFFYFVVR